MAKSRRSLVAVLSAIMALVTMLQPALSVQAKPLNTLEDYSGGVAFLFEPGVMSTEDVLASLVQNQEEEQTEEKSYLVMVSVDSSLNVRSEASEDAERVGLLYKNCAGTILERRDGWTRLVSGNLDGWAKDEFLLFDEEAVALANEVGKTIATVNVDALRVREEADSESKVLGQAGKDDELEVTDADTVENEWISVSYKGKDGFVAAEFVDVEFRLEKGETNDEIAERQAREAAEKKAAEKAAAEKAAAQKSNQQTSTTTVTYSEVSADADTTLLLAALIQCEAGGESYEGQLAVGAVVMNRVRSGSYPNTVYDVIYARGQFTPARNGDLSRVYSSGKIKQSCIDAANEALAGTSNVEDKTHFRRNDGRDGIVIGNHVFY